MLHKIILINPYNVHISINAEKDCRVTETADIRTVRRANADLLLD